MYRTVTIDSRVPRAEMLARLRAATRPRAGFWKWVEFQLTWTGPIQTGVAFEGRVEGDAFVLRRLTTFGRSGAHWAIVHGRIDATPGGSRLFATFKPHPVNLVGLCLFVVGILWALTLAWQAAVEGRLVPGAFWATVVPFLLVVGIASLHYSFAVRAAERSLRESLDRPTRASLSGPAPAFRVRSVWRS